jgi:pimeloyl-ACP methyl ester carboxylesterase
MHASPRLRGHCRSAISSTRVELRASQGHRIRIKGGMTEERIIKVASTGIELAYERFGEHEAPPVLLVMGLAAQMVHWPDAFCAALAAHGLQVVRFDNRDVGRSTHLTNAPMPNLQAALSGDLSSAAYTLSEMAADAMGLLDALAFESAHLVGASMGGAIAQAAAIEHPGRVRSLTSMMSSTGNASVGQPNAEALRKIFDGPPPTTREDVVERAVRAFQVLGSPAFERDESAIREIAGRAFDRGHDPMGIARQAVASVASGDRTSKLRSLAIPTLVLHGAADLMCDVSGARATAAAIPHAELVIIEGMGHDLPRELWPEITSRVAGLVWRAEAGSS